MAPDKSRKNLENNILPKGEIVIYKTSDKRVQLDVKLEKETVWLTQKQISQLFNTDRSVITRHLKNIFKSRELEEKERNVQKIHIPFSDKPVKLYNLDVVISVGYRVNSKRATQFRIWATQVLYETVEEKAANLLYLTIKDHPFIDGNKRIGSLLFIYFIEENDYLYKANGERKITDTTLVALALLIANSDPKEKDIMINIITNLLK